MDLGWPVWAVLVGAIVAVALAVFYWRFRASNARPRSRDRSSLLNQARVEVLESTAIDAERRLVLVRCDKIEHLIMVGGPADLVVENDVRKVRGPATPAKQAPNDLPARGANGRGATSPMRAPSPPIETARQERPALNHSEPSQNRANLSAMPAPAQRPAGRNAPAAPTPTLAREDAAQRNAGRRDAANITPPRRPQSQPAPAAAGLSGERPRLAPSAANDRQPRPTAVREPPRPVTLPPAEAPWPDGDSIENDIVAAFREVRPQSAGPLVPAARMPAVVRDPRSADATLGDLADRLEEALAQEVQAANEDRRQELDLDAFGFDRTRESTQPTAAAAPIPAPAPAPEPKKIPEQRKLEAKKPVEPKERVALKERVEAARAAASAPEPEAKREPPPAPERREEAPVISLNARRREAVDPLEDEMARLLGELTGDTKGR